MLQSVCLMISSFSARNRATTCARAVHHTPRQSGVRGAPPSCLLAELATTPADELLDAGWELAAEACHAVVGIDLTGDALQPGKVLLWALFPRPRGEGDGQERTDPTGNSLELRQSD